MSDDSTTPKPAPSTDETGIVDLTSTQALPQDEPTPIVLGAPAAPARSQAGAAPGPTTDGWFDQFASERPTDGPAVPTRADSSWGSDRADALAEEAHRAAYTPANPYAPPASTEVSQHPSTGAVAAETTPVEVPAGPAGSADADDRSTVDTGAPVPHQRVRRRGRGRLVAGVAALCLASGVVGGVAGQVIDDRINLGGSTLPEPGPGASARPAGSVANIAANVLPSVVTIKVDAGADGQGTGSGFVIDAKGHILTNNHVVSAGASGGTIKVVLSNGDTEEATIVGRDEGYDLAVLKIGRTDLTPLQLGASSQVVVGDQVIAVGAPLGLDQTVTTGIVSALNRPVLPGSLDENSFINAIQTDAAINPGNSGGPLLDMTGKVIGINSAIARVPGTTSSTGGNIGLGFAIPSDQARRTADQLIATGKATHPVIGVSLNRTFAGEGAQVVDGADAIIAGGPAAKAGVKPGDVIIGFEGKRVRSPDELIVSIRARAVGETVTLKIDRDGTELELKMVLEADPKG